MLAGPTQPTAIHHTHLGKLKTTGCLSLGNFYIGTFEPDIAAKATVKSCTSVIPTASETSHVSPITSDDPLQRELTVELPSNADSLSNTFCLPKSSQYSTPGIVLRTDSDHFSCQHTGNQFPDPRTETSEQLNTGPPASPLDPVPGERSIQPQYSEVLTMAQNVVLYDSAPNGEWGWLVILGSFMCIFIVDGLCYSYGVFMHGMIAEHQFAVDIPSAVGTTQYPSLSSLSFPGALLAGTTLLSGPVAGALVNRFNYRSVAAVGALIATISIFLSALLTYDLTYFTILFGLFGGIGCGLIYLPAITVVGHWFDQHRALVVGIAMCGNGFGTAILPFITRSLCTAMMWRGALIIVAGLFCQALVGIALFRPLYTHELIRLAQTERRRIREQRKVRIASKSERLRNNRRPNVERRTRARYGSIMARIIEEKSRQRTTSTGSLDGMVITRENELVALSSPDAYETVMAAVAAYAAAQQQQQQQQEQPKSDTPPIESNTSNPETSSGPLNETEKRPSCVHALACRGQPNLQTLKEGEPLRSNKNHATRSNNVPCLAVLPPPVQFTRGAVHRIACAIVRKLQTSHAIPCSMSFATESICSRRPLSRSHFSGEGRIESWCAFEVSRFPRSERESVNFTTPETDSRSLGTQYFPKHVSLNVSMAFNAPTYSQCRSRSSDSNMITPDLGQILNNDRPVEQFPDEDRLLPSVPIEPSQPTSQLTSMISLDSQTNSLIVRELRGLPLDNQTKAAILAALRAELSRPKYRSDLFFAASGRRFTTTADRVNAAYLNRNEDCTERAPACPRVTVTEFVSVKRQPRVEPVIMANEDPPSIHQCTFPVVQNTTWTSPEADDKFSEMISYLRDMLDIHLLSSVTFLVLLLACSVNMLVLLVPFYYLPLLLSCIVVQSSKNEAIYQGEPSTHFLRQSVDSAPSSTGTLPNLSPEAIMLSIGLASVVGRMLAAVYIEKGVNTNRQLFKRCRPLNDPIMVNNLCLILCGLSLAYFPPAIRGLASIQSELQFAVDKDPEEILLYERTENFRLVLFHTASIIYGLANGMFLSLRSLILVDLFGIGRLTNAFGYLLIFQGLTIICGPPLFGYFCDSECQRQLNLKAPGQSAVAVSACASRLAIVFYAAAAIFVLTSLLFLPLRWLSRHDPYIRSTRLSTASQQFPDQVYVVESVDSNPRTMQYDPQDTQTTHVFSGLDANQAAP